MHRELGVGRVLRLLEAGARLLPIMAGLFLRQHQHRDRAFARALQGQRRIEAGADAIEIGIPFSDPIMDGPVIQQASQKALDDAKENFRLNGLDPSRHGFIAADVSSRSPSAAS